MSSPGTPPRQTPNLDRRRLLGCAALFGVAVPVLAGCGSEGPPRATGPLVAAADVPVGGGVVVPEAGIVVTQPTKGSFKGFSSACTHQGETLTASGGGKLTCPRHGSQFAVEDGANLMGPNGSSAGSVADLPEVAVKVVRGKVVTA